MKDPESQIGFSADPRTFYEQKIKSTSPIQDAWDYLDSTADTEAQWLDGQAAFLRMRMTGLDDRIGRIGAGVQYVVYELPGSKVFKVAQTPKSAANEHLRQGGDAEEVADILRYREESVNYIRKLLSTHPEVAPLFGNPKFNDEIDEAGAIEQDKVTVLGQDGFSALSSQDQINYIRGYVSIIRHCWTYGCSDRTMNFQVNTGVNNKGEITLIDFGEIDITKETALATVKERPWETAWGLRVLDENMRAKALDIFGSELTAATLESLWATKL